MLIDTHAHLFWDSFEEDFDQVIKRCLQNNVTTLINVGTSLETSIKASKMESTQVKFYSSVGIHPGKALQYPIPEELAKSMRELEEIYRKNPEKIVGVGECGLDFSYLTRLDWKPQNMSDEEAKQLQIKLFQAHIDLAKKLDLPLLVHIRDDRSKNSENTECWDLAIEMCKDSKGIWHCYSGLPQTTDKTLGTNFLFSFAGNATYPNNKYIHEAIKTIPLERIVVETDCPFLPPQSHRGQRNEPSFITEVTEFIAEVKGVSFEEVASQTTNNVKHLLKLS